MEPTILIADDDDIITNVVQHKFGAAGMCVHTCDNGLSAWDYLNQHPVDLLITDLRMPGLDGDELCHRVRAVPAFEHMPIIMLTGRSYELAGDFLKMARVQELVTKPFSPNALLKQVQMLLPTRELANTARQSAVQPTA